MQLSPRYIRCDLIKTFFRILMCLGLIVIAAGMLYPLVFMILGSFKSSSEVLTIHPTFIPQKVIYDNYIEVARIIPLVRNISNSIIVTVSVTFLTAIISALAGYVFGKYRFPGRDVMFFLVLATMMIPVAVTLIPLFMLCSSLGWVNTYQGLIIPVCLNPFGIYLVTQFAKGIPSDYLDAGRIDGLSELRIFFNIALPLLKPPIAALVILTFYQEWDSLLWPMVIAQDPAYWTLPIGIQTVGFSRGTNFGAHLAIASISVAPILIIYIIFQKQFVRGVVLSGIK